VLSHDPTRFSKRSSGSRRRHAETSSANSWVVVRENKKLLFRDSRRNLAAKTSGLVKSLAREQKLTENRKMTVLDEVLFFDWAHWL
jgi:hypothetical protein